MAQKVTVALEDDLTGGPAQQTVRLAVDGTDYETGLSAKNAAASGQPARAPHCGSMNSPVGHNPFRHGGRTPAQARVLAPAPTER